MTPWHYRCLCQFSYIDLPPGSDRRGRTLGALARELLSLSGRDALSCGQLTPDDRAMLHMIADAPGLSSLVLIDYINLNRTTGFVAYAFRAPDDSVHCVLRGSEGRGCGVPTPVDWVDNFLAPLYGSLQYEDAAALARRFPEERVTFSGHSKGAHNALYALASLPSERADAVVFNGQGFSRGQLTRAQKTRLQRQGVNYVTRGDVVGSLLWHPERRIFVRRKGENSAHALSSFTFDASGQPVPAHRPVWSTALEIATRLYVRGARPHDRPPKYGNAVNGVAPVADS